MTPNVFLTRVVLSNYRSIGNADVRLGPLTYLVGRNGAGKSNFLDAFFLRCERLVLRIIEGAPSPAAGP